LPRRGWRRPSPGSGDSRSGRDARKELTLRAGLAAVAAYGRDEGAFTAEELAEAEAWVLEVAERSDRVGRRIRRTA